MVEGRSCIKKTAFHFPFFFSALSIECGDKKLNENKNFVFATGKNLFATFARGLGCIAKT
jgi:hypothetical protein